MEEHFFFDNEGEQVFGVLHRPLQKSRRGMVFCYPFAEERQEAHRVLVNFARLSAEKGFFVLRFDYRGTGDSCGEFEDYGLDARIQDISRAIEILREKAGVEEVGLLGLRLGATFAALAARKARDVRFLIMWVPIPNVAAYLHQFLRGNLALQMATDKKITVTREELVNQLREGKEVNVQGYHLSGKFYTDAIETDPLRCHPSAEYPTLVVRVETRANPDPLLHKLIETGLEHPNSEHCVVNEEPFWLEKKYYIPDSGVFFEKTLKWMESIA